MIEKFLLMELGRTLVEVSAATDAAKMSVNAFSAQMFAVLFVPVAIFSIFFYLLGLSGFFPKKRFPTMKGKLPKITVQIPTFNEPVALRCARRCLEFDYPADKFEIIIGDDSSDEEVSALIDEFAAKHDNIKVTRRGSNEGFKAGNLNHMLQYSKGDIIVIFDSDFVPPRNFLRRIVQPFGDRNVAAAQAKWKYLNMAQSKTSKFGTTILMVYHNLLARLNSRFGVSLLFGSGEAVRKSVLKKLGGWQEGSVTEDVEFSARLLKEGYKTVYLDDLHVSGEVPYNPKSLRIQQRRWAYGNMRAFLDHKKSILFGKLSAIQKLLITATMTGYISSFFLVAFMFFGVLAFMTGEPGAINVNRLIAETSINFLAASGFTFAGIVALWREKRLSHVFVIFFTALTVGILVSLSVCKGVFKALSGRSMYWTMIPKTGNKDFLSMKPIIPYTQAKKGV